MDAVETIAAGGQPSWEKTYPHPDFPDGLTFKVSRLPTAQKWLDQAVAQDNLTHGLMAIPSGSTILLAAALASMQTIIECPVIHENRVEDPDNPDHITVETIRYDPLRDPDISFVVGVYTDFWAWRQDLLNRVGEVEKSSGETSGGEFDESLPPIMASPSTTPA